MLEQQLQSLAEATVASLDTETNSEKGEYLKCEIFSVAWRDSTGKTESYAGLFETFLPVWEILHKKKIVFHNAKYDFQVLKAEGFTIDDLDFEDTMIMSHLIDENARKALKDLRKNVLNKPERAKWKDIDKADIVAYLKYAKEDAVDTLDLYYTFKDQIYQEQLEVVYELEKRVIYPVLEMEYYGCPINVDLLYKQDKMLEEFMETAYTKIHDYVPSGQMYNLSSTKQLQKLFFDVLGYPRKKEWATKTGHSTAAHVLDYIANDPKYPTAKDVANVLKEYRTYSKLKSSFTGGLKTKVKDNGRIYPSFNSTGARTGRFSASDPNLQQVPRLEYIEGDMDTHIRSLFIAEVGKYILTADYSQIELRMMAELSQDFEMCNAFRRGIDMHTLTATRLHMSRQHAKNLNFGVGYGMGAGSFAAMTGLSFQQAMVHIENFWITYSGLANFMEDMKKKARATGYIRTISGRKRRFIYSNDTDRQAMNTTIQGSSADLIKMALVKMYDEVDHKRAKFLMTVHDEISLMVDDDYKEEGKELLKYCMENIIPTTIPLTAQPLLGVRWSDNK